MKEHTHTHIHMYIYLIMCVCILECSPDEARIEAQIAEDLAFYEKIIAVDDAVLRAATLRALVCLSKEPLNFIKRALIFY